MNNTQTLTLAKNSLPARPAEAFLRAFSAETLKMKRTLALLLAFIAPLVIVAMEFISYMQRPAQMTQHEGNAWVFLGRQTLTIWALLMQPLFVTLETALVAQLDHSSDHWKQLFAMPLPRWTIYAAKQVINVLLIALSLLLLLVYTLMSGILLQLIHPNLGLELPFPLQSMAWLTVLTFLGSLITIAIHHWVALNWRSFVVASAFGIAMTFAGVMVINTEQAGYYPWTLSAVLVNGYAAGDPYLHLLIYGCLVAPLLAILGCWLFTRKDVL